MYKLGIDIGASHIGLGIYDSKKNILVKKKYLPYKNPPKIFNKILTKTVTKKYTKNLIANIDKFIADYKIEYIGLGCPGGVDPKNAIFYGSKALVLGKINFKEELKKYKCPVYVDNDCNCAAIGEAINNDYDKFLMITIGTGVGFALIKKKKGKILLAKDEIIWKILSANKVPNKKHEKYISSFKKLSDRYNKRIGKKLPREAIFDDIKNNKDLLNRYINDFNAGIKLISKEVQIKNICIGGSFSSYKRFYLKDLQKILEKYNVFIAKKNNDSGIIGATQLPIKKY